jgi:hypothetical protein
LDIPLAVKTKHMRYGILIIIFAHFQIIAMGQTKEDNASFTVGEFRVGYGNSILGNGLKEKFEAGNFSSSGGWLASIAAYHKFKKINNLAFGIKFKSLGAEASRNAIGQEMFFNYWGAATSVKYFPFDKTARKGLYLQGDYFFITQFTQKYRNKITNQYDHQFGIGSGIVLGGGYDFPIKNRKSMITIGLEYQFDNRTGEVTGIGRKTFESVNYGAMIGVKF